MPSWTVRFLSEAPNSRESAENVLTALESWGSWVQESDGGIQYTFVHDPAGSTTENDLDVSTPCINTIIERFFDGLLTSIEDDEKISVTIEFELDSGLPLFVVFESYVGNTVFPFEMSVHLPKTETRKSDNFETIVELVKDIYIHGSFVYAKLHRDESEDLVSDQQDAIRSPLTAFQILSLGTVYELGIDELSVLDFERTERLPDDSILLLVERRPTESSRKIREINESLGLE